MKNLKTLILFSLVLGACARPQAEETLGCEEYDAKYKCVPFDQCRIADCIKRPEGCPNETHAGQLGLVCLAVKSSTDDNVCCHESDIIGQQQPEDPGENKEYEDPVEPEPLSCDDLGGGYSCVDSSKCDISQCAESVDPRSGGECSSDHVKYLNFTCNEIKSSLTETTVCCHDDHKVKEVPLSCDDFEGYSCVRASNCDISNCADETSPKSGGDCLSEHVKHLNDHCNVIKTSLDEPIVCCHKDHEKTETSEVEPPCIDRDGNPCTDPTPTQTPTKKVPDYKPSCGRHNVAIDQRLSSFVQTESSKGEWPFMCALFLTTGNGTATFYAGASLIAPGVALTVAHWIEDLQNLQKAQLTVRCNLFSLTQDKDFVERNVSNITIHPGFDITSAKNDFGVLHLTEDFELSQTVDTICLPKTANVEEEFDGTACYAAGWGKDSSGDAGKLSDILRQIELPLKSHGDCQVALQTHYGPTFELHRSFICAGGVRGRDTCRGDGGGPLFCRKPGVKEEIYVQAGVTAWGVECGRPNIPGVYASTANGLCFIDYAVKCRHDNKYDAFVNVTGCDGWIEQEKTSYIAHKNNMEKAMTLSKNPVTQVNAKKEFDRAVKAIKNIESLASVCDKELLPEDDAVDIRSGLN